MSGVSQILSQIGRGDAAASEQLLPLVYEELRQLAAAHMAREDAGHTLQPTALVHEAYIRLVDGAGSPEWNHRGHFFAAAAESMRRILVERARRKGRVRHGGEFTRRPFDEAALFALETDDQVLSLDAALTKLAAAEPTVAGVVSLHCFAGLTIDDTARALEISPRTAHRYWAYARAWLLEEITRE